MFGSLGGGAAGGREGDADLGDQGAVRVRCQVRVAPLRHVRWGAERLRVVDEELDRAIVARLDVERRAGVREPVLAFVRLRERDEQLGRVRALVRGDGLAGLDAVEDARRVLLLERRVGAVDLARLRERARRPRKIAGELAGRRFVAEEPHAPLRILLQLELRAVERDRVLPLLELLVELARVVDGVGARRVELDSLLVVLDRLLRLGERRLRPEASELLVQPGELAPELRLAGRERGERLGPAVEEGDERFAVTLVTVQLREAIGRDLRGRVLLERHHQDPRGTMRITERRRPHVGRLGEPVGRVRTVARFAPDALEEHRIALGVFFTRGMGVCERFFVVRILDETLHQPIDLGAVHDLADGTTSQASEAIWDFTPTTKIRRLSRFFLRRPASVIRPSEQREAIIEPPWYMRPDGAISRARGTGAGPVRPRDAVLRG